jgi:DNA-binding GntR family transcriptional regulator
MVKKPLFADRIFVALKRDIIEGRLEPETIVVEGTLAQQFGVSKGPIREALKRLHQLGLVRAVPRVGYIVSSVSLGDLDEIFTMRLALEPVAARLAAQRASDVELEDLEAVARVPLELAHDPLAQRAPALARSNSEFHHTVAQLSRNGRLEATIAVLVDELERVVHMLGFEPLDEGLISEHSQLVATLRSRNADEAEQTMRRQLENDRENLTRVSLASDHAWMPLTSRSRDPGRGRGERRSELARVRYGRGSRGPR